MHDHIRSGPPRAARLWRGLFAALALLAGLGGVPAAAQTGVVSGTVVESGSGRPIGGAQVSVQGQDRRTVTDAQGRFTLAGVSGAQVTLQADRLGYARATGSARVGQADVRLQLAESVLCRTSR
jgi:hypothetical protein